jgi:hypothetical protein
MRPLKALCLFVLCCVLLPFGACQGWDCASAGELFAQVKAKRTVRHERRVERRGAKGKATKRVVAGGE